MRLRSGVYEFPLDTGTTKTSDLWVDMIVPARGKEIEIVTNLFIYDEPEPLPAKEKVIRSYKLRAIDDRLVLEDITDDVDGTTDV